MTQDINSEILDNAITQGFAHAQTTGVPADATENLAGFVHTVTTNHPEVLAAAAAAFTMKIAKIVLCVVAALGLSLGAYALYKTVGPGAQNAATESSVVMEETTPGVDTPYTFAPATAITFEGGTTAEHINPLSALATTDQGVIERWTIVDAEGDTIAQGEGAHTGEVLAELPEGIYTVSFTITDDTNATALVQRDFVIQ